MAAAPRHILGSLRKPALFRRRGGAWPIQRHSATAHASLAEAADFAFDPLPEMPPLFNQEMQRPVYNFSSGPGPLPEEVMERAQSEFMNWPGAPGMSVMSISHREKDGPYQQLMKQVESQVREALDVPRDYHVLFMQGGAHAQFSAVPLNLAGGGMAHGDLSAKRSSHVDTGFWARRAASEHSKYTQVAWAASADPADPVGASHGGPYLSPREWTDRGRTLTALPPVEEWAYSAEDAYVHLCANETISGLEFTHDVTLPPAPLRPTVEAGYDPSGGDVPAAAPPLVADFTSTLLSRPVDIEKYGVIYCSGGKNLGPAGVTLVLVHDKLLRAHSEHPLCPSVLSYHSMASTSPIPNLYLTPPTFSLYMVGLVLEHIQASGGVQAAERRAIERSRWLYDIIDASDGFYHNPVEPRSRSRMSVPFSIPGGPSRSPEELAELEARFVADAETAGFRHIRGHPLAGGLRASLYHGVSDDSVQALAKFMVAFHSVHG